MRINVLNRSRIKSEQERKDFMEEMTLYNKIVSSGIDFIIDGLSAYGSEWSAKNICLCIEEKDEKIKKFLISLNNCGMYEFLVAICEIINTCCCKDIQTWFYEQLDQCQDREMIIEIVNRFHQNQVAGLEAVFPGLGKDFKYVLSVGMKNLQEYIWENYDPEFLRKISRSDSRNIGVCFPMISKDLEYMKRLEENVFPYLIMSAKDIREIGDEDRTREALVRMRIADYLVELGIFYYSQVERAFDALLTKDSKEAAEADYNKYFQVIQNILEMELGHRLYITNTMTDYLNELIHISEYFGDILYRKNILVMKTYLPLLYQLVGREKEAMSLLIDTIQYLPKSYAISKSYLITFYRGLLITKDEIQRQRLIGIFDEIYFSNGGVREFITVARHINIFYQKYSKNIQSNVSLLKTDYMLHDKALVVQWFKDGLISEKFNSLLKIIENESGFPRSKAINDFIQLFYSLSSHRESNIRIIPERCAEILDIKDCLNGEFDQKEVFNLYTEEENVQICKLAEQMENARNQMPAYKWQQYYIGIKQKAEEFWNMDADSVLCRKFMTAFRGIQSDPFNKWEFDRRGNILRKRDEDSINNLVAFFLKAYYGEENIHREEPQGLSGNGNKFGEIDILIYRNGTQFAIQEAVKIEALEKIKLDEHLSRLMYNYDTQGVPVTCLVIYAYAKQRQDFFVKIENYLEEYLKGDLFKYDIVNQLKREEEDTANICHHSVAYRREAMIQKLHIFTVLM